MEEAADEGGLAVVDVADDDDVHLAGVFGGGLGGGLGRGGGGKGGGHGAEGVWGWAGLT
jgi:hypothetical protein